MVLVLLGDIVLSVLVVVVVVLLPFHTASCPSWVSIRKVCLFDCLLWVPTYCMNVH